jgi:hypothetical protein
MNPKLRGPILARRGLNLDGDVTETRKPNEAGLVARGHFRLVRNQGHDDGTMAE